MGGQRGIIEVVNKLIIADIGQSFINTIKLF
jgi:hypothetical protein